MHDFNGLPLYHIVSVFTHPRVMCIPFFEVNVDIIVTNLLLSFMVYGLRYSGVVAVAVGVCSGSFPFWKNEFFWFDDYFGNLT